MLLLALEIEPNSSGNFCWQSGLERTSVRRLSNIMHCLTPRGSRSPTGNGKDERRGEVSFRLERNEAKRRVGGKGTDLE